MAISVWPFKNQCPLLPLHSNPPVMDPNLWGTQQHHRSCRRLLVLPLLWSVSSQRFLSILTSASPTAASASADAPPPLSRDGQTSPPRSLPHSTPAPVPPPPPAPSRTGGSVISQRVGEREGAGWRARRRRGRRGRAGKAQASRAEGCRTRSRRERGGERSVDLIACNRLGTGGVVCVSAGQRVWRRLVLSFLFSHCHIICFF